MDDLECRGAVLVIDEELAARTEVSRTLSAAGYTCHCCVDAVAALETAGQLTLDLVIADMHLAGYTGADFCEELRKQPGLGHVPFMFLSAVQLPDVIRRANGGGPAFHLRKPFDPAVLLELVGRAIPLPLVAHAAPHA